MDKTAYIRDFFRIGISLKDSRKGISPLVSTVLLVFLAIGLGVIVMNWGRAQLEENAKCSVDTMMEIVEIGGKEEICYAGSGENGFIEFTAENGPNIDISRIRMRVIGSRDIYTVEVPESSISIGGAVKKTVAYNFNLFGKIRQVKLTPRLELFPGESPILCDEQSIELENIPECR
ncbi:hypothetical protein GF336_06110 [Candidatus Woesearchaeota archaeon]|nr:hypothetical protein [Candidatus Woesearchaeota archaeon]